MSSAFEFYSKKADPTYSPSKKKGRKKKVMPTETHKAKKLKSLVCKDKKVSLDHSKKSRSRVRKRARYSDIYDDVEAKFSVMERAERVLSHLDNGAPYFLKCMLPSNVAHGFWLHLPRKFCSLHFPSRDSSIFLVDEWGNEYKTSYLLERRGLSAGWRGFSISHRLLKGDILIFHLIEPCKLQVHIVRVNCSEVVEAAVCLMNLEASSRGTNDSEDLGKKSFKKRKKAEYVAPFLLDISAPPEKFKRRNQAYLDVKLAAYHSESKINHVCSSQVHENSQIADEVPSDDPCLSEPLVLHGRCQEFISCV